MKPINLRKCNQYKYCIECKEVKRIEMQGLNGYCMGCLERDPPKRTKLFTLDNTHQNGKAK